MIIQIRATSDAIDAILTVISPLVTPANVELYERKELPKAENQESMELELLAQEIAKKIRPTAKQPMRHEALKVVLLGWDTFWDQQGESDASLRNAVGALSKAMRPIFPYDVSPIDRLATRTKHHSDDNHYLGTKYTPTELGNRVRDILTEQGVF